jgi:mannose-6-phosphate isomerase-like protein (cupin superfamily)
MGDYTVKNLHEVKDMAPDFGLAPAVSARFAARDLGLRESAVSLQSLAPNETQPFGHRHGEQEELYIVVAGSGQAKLDDDVVDVQAWDAVRVSPDVMRSFAAGPDGIEFLAIGAPAVQNPMDDVESAEGWWKR